MKRCRILFLLIFSLVMLNYIKYPVYASEKLVLDEEAGEQFVLEYKDQILDVILTQLADVYQGVYVFSKPEEATVFQIERQENRFNCHVLMRLGYRLCADSPYDTDYMHGMCDYLEISSEELKVSNEDQITYLQQEGYGEDAGEVSTVLRNRALARQTDITHFSYGYDEFCISGSMTKGEIASDAEVVFCAESLIPIDEFFDTAKQLAEMGEADTRERLGDVQRRRRERAESLLASEPSMQEDVNEAITNSTNNTAGNEKWLLEMCIGVGIFLIGGMVIFLYQKSSR